MDTHETKDCRKMLKARELANEHFRKKKASSAYGASHSEEPDDEQQENVEDGFAASQCYAVRSVFDWFADSGATASMTDQRQLLMDYETIKPGTWSVSGIGGTNLSVHGRGNVPIITEVKYNNCPINNEMYIYLNIYLFKIKGKESDFIIKNVLHVPGIGINLFSIGAATEADMECTFIGNKCNFYHNKQLILTGERAAKTMYYLNIRSKMWKILLTQQSKR